MPSSGWPFDVSLGFSNNEVTKSLFCADTGQLRSEGNERGEGKKEKGEPYLPPRTFNGTLVDPLLHSARHFLSPPGSQFEIHNNHVKNLPIKLPISINHRPPDTTTHHNLERRADTPHPLSLEGFFAKNFFHREKREGKIATIRSRCTDKRRGGE